MPRPLVGYNTCAEMQASTSEAMFNMMSIPFEGCDGKGISLNDLNFSNGSASSRPANADTIMLWVVQPNGEYDYEAWTHKTTGWMSSADGTSFDSKYPNGLPAGTTFWYKAAKRADAGSLTTSGAIVSDASVVKTIKRNSYNFVGYPYPVAFKLNDTTQVDWGEAATSSRPAQADTIMLWVLQDSGTYDYEAYTKKSAGWTSQSNGNLFEVNHKDGVTVGTGFWYKATTKSGSDNFDVTFKSPLALSE